LALIEAGHILQNLSLVASALGLDGLVSASFYEAELESLLGLDGVSEGVLAAFLMAGRPE
jgi:nitroreductase